MPIKPLTAKEEVVKTQPRETGAEATFAGVRKNVLKRIRLGGVQASQRIAQNVRTSGLKTSGVGLIPQLAASRTRQLAEAGAEEALGSQQLGNIAAEKAAAARARVQAQLQRDAYSMQGDLARTAARQRLQQALIGGAISAGVGGITGGIRGLAIGGAAARGL